MKFPILPLVFIAFGGGFASSTWLGAAGGLIAWTTIEALGEIFVVLRKVLLGTGAPKSPSQ